MPLVFLSGDRAAAEEVEALVPGVVTAVVNEGVRRGSASSLTAEENKRDSGAAVHLAPEAAREVIRRGAEEAIGRIGKVKPFRLDPPYTVESVLCPEVRGGPVKRAVVKADDVSSCSACRDGTSKAFELTAV